MNGKKIKFFKFSLNNKNSISFSGTHVIWWTQPNFANFSPPHVIWWTQIKIFPFQNLMCFDWPIGSIFAFLVHLYKSLIFNAFILWSLKLILYHLNWFQTVFLGFQPRIQLLTMSLLLENPTPICAALWQWEVGIFCPRKVRLKLRCLVF